jgi:hypothetical protein
LLILLTISTLTADQGSLTVSRPDISSFIDINVNLVENLIRTMPETTIDYTQLLVLLQHQKILQDEREEMLTEREGIRQKSQTIAERSFIFGFTAISLVPFISSSLLVFMDRMQWAIFSTGLGFAVLVAVLTIFQYYSLLESSTNTEDLIFLRQQLDENQRQFDNIQNQTNDELSSISKRLSEALGQSNKTAT